MATMKPFGVGSKVPRKMGRKENEQLSSRILYYFLGVYRGTQKFCMVGNNIRERYSTYTHRTTRWKKKDKSPWGPSTSLLYYSVVLAVLSSLFAWIFSRQCSSHFSSPLSPVLLARQVSKFSRKEEWQGEKKGNKVHTIRHFVRFDGLEFICTFFFPPLSLWPLYYSIGNKK